MCVRSNTANRLAGDSCFYLKLEQKENINGCKYIAQGGQCVTLPLHGHVIDTIQEFVFSSQARLLGKLKECAGETPI